MVASDLQIAVIVSAPLDENAYVLWLADRDDCVVVDPGTEPDKILSFLDEKRLSPALILCTHGHSDHIAGNGALKSRWPACPLIIGAGDADKLTNADGNLSSGFGIELVSPPADRMVNEGDVVEGAGLTFDVLETPGHSSGHVIFVLREHSPTQVLGGDVLFQGSVGRFDLPDSNGRDLLHSIHEKLFRLPDDTVVHPGHGPSTTIGAEKRTNPFVGAPAGFQF